MAESRKMKTEKGLALVPGANPLADGCNFAVEVPEDSRASLILYKKRSENLMWRFLLQKKTEPEMYMQCIFRILI